MLLYASDRARLEVLTHGHEVTLRGTCKRCGQVLYTRQITEATVDTAAAQALEALYRCPHTCRLEGHL